MNDMELDALSAYIEDRVRLARYEGALRSIASSACCDRCNEAKLVAQDALKERFNSREFFDRSFPLAEPRGTTGE